MEYKHLRSQTNRCATFAIKPPQAEEIIALLPYINNKVKLSVRMGIAECSLRDSFSKKIGRSIASKRFNSESDKTLELLEMQLIKTNGHSILFTDFLYENFVITFRSFIAKDYSKTDCHAIRYWE